MENKTILKLEIYYLVVKLLWNYLVVVIDKSHVNQTIVHQFTKGVRLNKQFRPEVLTLMNTKYFRFIQTSVIREKVFIFFVKFIFVV